MTKDGAQGVGHSPVCQMLLQIVLRAVITSSPPAWTSSAGMLSTTAVFPFFGDCTAAFTSLRKMGWSSSVSVWGPSSIDGFPLALWLYSSMRHSVHRFSISRSSVRHLTELSWTVVAFPCFTVWSLSRVGTVVLPHIFFNLTTLFSYPVFFCLFHAPLDVVVHFLVFFRSFMFKSFLTHFSPYVVQIKNFCSNPGFFFFRRCLPRISLAVSITAVLKVVITESMSVSEMQTSRLS